MRNEIKVTHKKRVTNHALMQLSDKLRYQDKSSTIPVIPLKTVSNCSALICRLNLVYFVQEMEFL